MVRLARVPNVYSDENQPAGQVEVLITIEVSLRGLGAGRAKVVRKQENGWCSRWAIGHVLRVMYCVAIH